MEEMGGSVNPGAHRTCVVMRGADQGVATSSPIRIGCFASMTSA